jgi:hypothetical protein
MVLSNLIKVSFVTSLLSMKFTSKMNTIIRNKTVLIMKNS